MHTERRSAPRHGLNSLIYLDLEPDNGGILLNLSEDGMQISVANRLVTSSEVRFTLCLQPSEKICGIGRIAWLSPSGRSAGVHFLNLPESARREIRQWMGQSADSLSADDTQAILEPAKETLQPETSTAAPIEAPALAEPDPETPNVEVPPFSPVEAPAPRIEAPAFFSRQTPEAAESPAATPAVEALPVFSATQEVVEPPAHATIVAAPAPLPMEAKTSQPLEPPLEAVAVEAPEVEVPSPAIEASAPAPMDALKLLELTVEAPPPEAVPPAWTPAAMAPIETPLAGGAGPLPSVLSLYGIDGREKEKEELKLPAPPPQALKQENAKPPIAAVSPHIRRRAEARRRARAAARSPLRPRPEIQPDPVILDGLTDVSASSTPSTPAGREATLRARALKLTSPIFIPAPPQFQLPPPENTRVEAYSPPPPAIETPRTETSQPEPWPVHSARVPDTMSATAPLSETHAEETTLAHGALICPTTKSAGLRPTARGALQGCFQAH